jgi:1-aminocyclopropane-1-carboxylate deaminase/D-cysteine desulfhydrase-like pyridoxal-dependent ACC family enzyme
MDTTRIKLIHSTTQLEFLKRLTAHLNGSEISNETNVLFIHTGGSPLRYLCSDKLFLE